LSRSNISARLFHTGFAAALIVFISGCGDHAPPEPPAARVAVLSGNNQQIFDGSRFSEPLAVRVTGPGGGPAAGVEVQWSVAPGLGDFQSFPDEQPLTPAISVTDTSGAARIYFFPKVIGNAFVSALASSVSPRPAEFFVTDRPEFEIVIGPMFDCNPFNDTTRFSLNKSSDMNATVNATVSLAYYKGADGSCAARIKTTAVPQGAEPFDTGVLIAGATFVFKPRVAGIWEFTDLMNGGSGRLIVH
jgi:hypothetical protein